MSATEVREVLARVRQASDPGRVEDGTRVHIRYEKMPGARVTSKAVEEAQRASELGLPPDTYTGRVSRMWTSGAGHLILNVFVELQRDHRYRRFNVDRGTIRHIVVLGN